MNQVQKQIAVAILDVLSEHNGRATYSGILSHVSKLFGETNQARGDRAYVIDKLEAEYQLIRRQNALVFLADNGELAKKMGFEKYIEELHASQRLDLKLKRLEFKVKLVQMITSSPQVITAFATTLFIVVLLISWLISLASELIASLFIFFTGTFVGGGIMWIKSQIKH